MITRTRTRGDDVLVEPDDPGPRPRGCCWRETVCTEAPTHQVTQPGEGDEVAAQVFCARHYVLALAELREVHVPQCVPLADHLVSFGPLA